MAQDNLIILAADPSPPARPRSSSVAVALAVLVAATLSAPAVSAAPTALEVGPADPPFVAALLGVGAVETQLNQLAAYMTRVGLEEPGVDALKAMAFAELGLKARGPLATALGLATDGSIALYGVALEDRLDVTIAADVSDRKKVIATLVMLEESDQWVPDGEQPKRAKVTKRKLPGRGLEVHVALPDERGVTARFQGDVMVMSQKPEALDAMRLGGGSRPPIIDKARRGAKDTAFVLTMNPRRIAELEGDRDPVLQMLQDIAIVSVWGVSGVDTWGEITFDEEVAPFLAIAKPAANGAAARAAMQGLAGEGTGMWFRWSVDAQAAFELARSMMGPALDDGIKEMQAETGLHLKKDLVDVFTGDMLLSCREGLADCLFVLGVTDPSKASKTVIAALDAIAKDAKRMGHDTQRRKDAGGQGSAVFETTFFEVPWDWDKDKPRKPARDERRPDVFRMHWAVRGDALIFGFTPAEVAAATSRRLPAARDLPPLLAGGRGFGDKDLMAGYQQVSDPSTLLRQILPIVRSALPALGEPGILVRAADALIALQDLIVDGGSVLEISGTTFRFQGRVRPVPGTGQEGFDAGLSGRYEAALAQRYQGRIRSSNEALLALADAAAGTVWASKARALALSGDSLGPLLLGAMGGMGTFLGLARAVEFDEPATLHAQPAVQPASGSCAALESLTCSGPNFSRGSCQIARGGIDMDCEAEFKALLGGP